VRVSYWIEPSKAMNAKTRMNPRKRPLKSRERWHPLAKLGVNYRSFGLNEGHFRRKPLTRKELTKTRIQGEFIPNPDQDLRRKTTGGRRTSCHNTLQKSDLRRAREFDSQKYSQTKYNNQHPEGVLCGPSVRDPGTSWNAPSPRGYDRPATPFPLSMRMLS
jgi:hypothetical protein